MQVNDLINKLLLGGFLKGYRTYVIAAGLVAHVVAQYLAGDIGLVQAIQDHWVEVATALGLYAAADHSTPAKPTA